jgi:hypothetical protein
LPASTPLCLALFIAPALIKSLCLLLLHFLSCLLLPPSVRGCLCCPLRPLPCLFSVLSSFGVQYSFDTLTILSSSCPDIPCLYVCFCRALVYPSFFSLLQSSRSWLLLLLCSPPPAAYMHSQALHLHLPRLIHFFYPDILLSSPCFPHPLPLERCMLPMPSIRPTSMLPTLAISVPIIRNLRDVLNKKSMSTRKFPATPATCFK